MQQNVELYHCPRCGKIVSVYTQGPGHLVCCNIPMEKLQPNTRDAALEKHVPVVHRQGQTVTVEVGSTHHPMPEEHWIPWVVLETCCGQALKYLSPEGAPVVHFALAQGEEPNCVYAYCNLHGLWRSEV